jgi:uncharacterized membrane protein
MGWPRRQLESLAIIVGGTAGAVALAFVALWLLPEPSVLTMQSGELLARTEPSLLDLGIAVAAGTAGAYVLIRREAIGALPGVAIAVALVPPLSAVGMTLELGEPALAREALLPYLTNVAGIVLAGALVLLLVGIRPHTVRGRFTRRVRIGVARLASPCLPSASRSRPRPPTGREPRSTTTRRLSSSMSGSRAPTCTSWSRSASMTAPSTSSWPGRDRRLRSSRSPIGSRPGSARISR